MFDNFNEKYVQMFPTPFMSEAQLVLLCIFTAFVCGMIITIAYRIKNPDHSRYLLLSLVLMPVIVMSLVLVVNQTNSIGTGVAIAGAFALIRFRSVPGNSRDMLSLFMSVTIGIAIGATYIWFAITVTLIASAILVGLKFIPIERKTEMLEREIRVTVPEDVDYQIELSAVFTEYCTRFRNIAVKTDKMGSLFTVTYRIRLKKLGSDKELIDAIRVKNGNLPIVCKSYDREIAVRAL